MAITITCLIFELGTPCPAFLAGRSGAAAAAAAAAVLGLEFCGVEISGAVRSKACGSEVRPQAVFSNSAQASQRGMSLGRAQRELEQRAQLTIAERDRVGLQAAARTLDHA